MIGVRWLLGIALAAFLILAPYAYYRLSYSHSKRLRVVTPQMFYRSGQLTAAGLDEALRRFDIRTVINLRNESPDPHLGLGVSESEICRRHNTRHVFIAPDLLDHEDLDRYRPRAIDQYLAILDDPANYPVLIHCQAGLHRTGVFTALYRMEYQGWSVDRALHEVKAHGFGPTCHAGNDYVLQYVMLYQTREQQRQAQAQRQRLSTRADRPRTAGSPRTSERAKP
jgi:protein-tyrosine phosphatase